MRSPPVVDAPERGWHPGAADRGIIDDETTWVGRGLRTLAGVFVVTWSFRLSGYLTFAPWLAVPVMVLGLAGLLVIVAAWLPGSVLGSRRQDQIGWAALVAALIALALWSYFQVFTNAAYGTDEVAFDQYAAQLALHGINPYLHSMAPAFPLFHVSPNGYTFQLNGQPITTLSYPALSFEAYLPLLALGLATQAAVWANVAAWALGVVVLYAVLPRNLAPLAVVVASADTFIGYAAGGVTDCLFVPLLVGAAVGWDRFASARGPAAWRGPVLMGLAMAVKQTPWLVVPFVVAGIVVESRQERGWSQALRDGLRYAGIALAAFLAPNVPYLIAAPGAWLHGVLTPLSSRAVPAGQGLISFSLSLAVSIQSVQTTGQLATVEQVTLAVVNKTGSSVRPAFTIEDGTVVTAFWRRQHGPAVLGPHQRASYTIVAPSYFAMPSIDNGFQVLAFLRSPASVSRTGSYLASTWGLALQPEAINNPVAVGQEITVHAEILNRLDARMRVANVPVYLGQVIYAQRGLQYGQAVINQGQPGQTPVEALTNPAGVATFTIHSPVADSQPVYFEANLVNPTLFYPYGYSPILAVRFGP